MLPDCRLVARDDQLGFSRIENIRSRQSGSIFAPAVEDGLGAPIGEKISPVADTLGGQGDRNIIEHQLEKFLGAFQLQGKRFVVGDVIEQRDQEFRLVLVVARDHAIGGNHPLLRAALDLEFVAEPAVGRIERSAVRRLYACRCRGPEDFIGAAADDGVAGKTRKAFQRPVGKNIAAILDALGAHAYRHVIEH